MYTSATWIVKSGQEDEFERAWQRGVDQMALENPGVTFRLLRDVEHPLRFVSIGGAWRSAEQIAAARGAASFREALAAIDELVESRELSTYDLVLEVS